MNLYKIEWNNRLNQDDYGNWKGMVSYIMGIDESDCMNWLYNKIGKNNCFIKLVESIPIHGITTYQIQDIITENYEIWKNIDFTKSKNKEISQNQYNTLLNEKKQEWYDIDRIVNDGREYQKEQQIWDKKKYV